MDKAPGQGPNGDCWLWTGKVNNNGYGPHRRAYRDTKGDPNGLVIRHTCDVRRCMNPDHLIGGTQLENMADARAKGRLRGGVKRDQRGSANNGAKVSDVQAAEVIRLHAEGIPQAQISRAVGVSKANVWCIVHGVSWKHLTREAA